MPKKSKKPDIVEGLSDKQLAFCREYLKDFNATQAAIRAGYSQKATRQIASELLAKPDIQNQIQEFASQINEKTGNDIEKIILRLQLFAFGSLRDVADWDANGLYLKDSETLGEKAVLISEITETRNDKGTTLKVKLHDPVKCLELLGRYHKIFTDKIEVIDLTNLSDEELLRRNKMLVSSLESPKS